MTTTEQDPNLTKLEQIRDFYQDRFREAGSDVVLRCGKSIGYSHYVLSFSIATEGAPSRYTDPTDFHYTQAELTIENLREVFAINAKLIEDSHLLNSIKIEGSELEKFNTVRLGVSTGFPELAAAVQTGKTARAVYSTTA